MVSWALSDDARMSMEIFGAKLSMSQGIAVALVITILSVLVFTVSFVKDVMAIPQKLKAREQRTKLERGVAAVSRGMESIAIGDAADALHHVRVAQRNLGDAPMTRLLSAQAAQLAGDDKAAGESFTAMLEAPETEFLGLRGLFAKAVKEGDTSAARQYAERAFNLRPNAAWAFDAVFDLALDRGAWGDAIATLKPALKNKTISLEEAKRAEAALLTAAAHASYASGDNSGALEEVEKALTLAPGLSPAATLASRLHFDARRAPRASKILETAFAEDPHPSLVGAFVKLQGDQPADKFAEGLKRLAARNPSNREAKITEARAALLLGDATEAIDILEPLLMETATARELKLMAEAVAAKFNDIAARPWLERAANAVRDAAPGVDGTYRFTKEGWAQLVREYRKHGHLAPTSLEGPPIGVAAEEMKLLIAPPLPQELELEEQDDDKGDLSSEMEEEKADAGPEDLDDVAEPIDNAPSEQKNDDEKAGLDDDQSLQDEKEEAESISKTA